MQGGISTRGNPFTSDIIELHSGIKPTPEQITWLKEAFRKHVEGIPKTIKDQELLDTFNGFIEKIGAGGTVTKSGLLKKQGGYVDPQGIWDGLSELTKGVRVLLKDGRVGTVLYSKSIPNRTMDSWKEYRQQLHDQAFQGYMAGQHTFEQATQIFDRLLEQNKDKLTHLSKEYQDVRFIPRVQIDGESRPKFAYPEDIERVYSGPSKLGGVGKKQCGLS